MKVKVVSTPMNSKTRGIFVVGEDGIPVICLNSDYCKTREDIIIPGVKVTYKGKKKD